MDARIVGRRGLGTIVPRGYAVRLYDFDAVPCEYDNRKLCRCTCGTRYLLHWTSRRMPITKSKHEHVQQGGNWRATNEHMVGLRSWQRRRIELLRKSTASSTRSPTPCRRTPQMSRPSTRTKGTWMYDIKRLVEYGWKPHRDVLAQEYISRPSIYWYMHETQKGKVSSNSSLQTVLFQQYSANLSDIPGTMARGVGWYEM